MKKIYVTPLCETVLPQMAHNLLKGNLQGESRWGVNGENNYIINCTGDGDEEDNISFNSRGSLWDDDSDLLE